MIRRSLGAGVRYGSTLLLALTGCEETGDVEPVGGDGVRARLERLATAPDPGRNRFANSAILERTLAESSPPHPLRLAEELVNTGRFDDAVALLEGVLADLVTHNRGADSAELVPEAFTLAAKHLLAVAHFRRGDRDHCLRKLGTAACSVPAPPATEADQPDLREAARLYAELAHLGPNEFGHRWMANVAHIMLGDYPDGVPEGLLIPPEAFGSAPLPQPFTDLAPALGLDVLGHVGGAVMDDFGGDGLLDIMATSWQLRDPIRYHVNRGDGGFDHLAGAGGLEGLWGGGNVKQADYDNDGDLDVFVMRGGWLPDGQPNSLLENQGDGSFRDVTARAGLLDPEYPSQTAVWLDFDGDGLLDLYIGNETWDTGPHPAQLFRNLGDGTFTDVAQEAGVAVVGIVKAVISGDYDNDGRPDIYVSRTGASNILLHNDGPGADGRWSFSDRTAEAGVGEPIDAFPAWFWDFDNDGWLDIYVAGYRTSFGDIAREYLSLPHSSELPRLYRNRGDETFEDVTAKVGLDRIHFAMGSNFGDLDNDGWLDIYVGTGDPNPAALMPNRMFRSEEGEVFEEVTTAGGFGLLHKGHGVAFGDIDHDGDQDVFIAMGGAYEGDQGRNVLFVNPGHDNRWLSLRLEGRRSNRSAFGARALVRATSGGGTLALHRTVNGGGSFGGNPLRLHFGLGSAPSLGLGTAPSGGEGLVSVRVEWPASGLVDEFEGVEVNAAYHLVEGSGELTRERRRRIELGAAGR